MKQLTLKLVVPLTVVSFLTFTKWWYTLPTDAPDTMFSGFPFPFVCDAWHTSVALQFFIVEFIADLGIYFSFFFIGLFLINRFLVKVKPPKALTIFLYSLTSLLITGAILISSNPDNVFDWKRDFDIKVMETGYKFYWQNVERPDYNKYHQNK